MDDKENPAKRNLSLNKALEILDKLVTYTRPVRLLDISKDTGLSTSTVHRFLKTFIDTGYVQQHPVTQLYSLTLKLAGMGYLCRQNYSVTANLQKYLEIITNHFSESSSLCIENDMNVVYVATREGPSRMLSTLSRIGKIAPMHCTGVGKLFLTQYPKAQLASFVEKRGLQRFTDHTICTLPDLERELEKIRADGCAWDDEECEIGAKCLAVPVYDYSGNIVAAMSFSCPVARFPNSEEAVEFMKSVGLQASRDLGYQG